MTVLRISWFVQWWNMKKLLGRSGWRVERSKKEGEEGKSKTSPWKAVLKLDLWGWVRFGQRWREAERQTEEDAVSSLCFLLFFLLASAWSNQIHTQNLKMVKHLSSSLSPGCLNGGGRKVLKGSSESFYNCHYVFSLLFLVSLLPSILLGTQY